MTGKLLPWNLNTNACLNNSCTVAPLVDMSTWIKKHYMISSIDKELQAIDDYWRKENYSSPKSKPLIGYLIPSVVQA